MKILDENVGKNENKKHEKIVQNTVYNIVGQRKMRYFLNPAWVDLLESIRRFLIFSKNIDCRK